MSRLLSLFPLLLLLVVAAQPASGKVDIEPQNRTWEIFTAPASAPSDQWPARLARMGDTAFHDYDFASDVRNGPNLYCYVHQNPWTMFDPEGLDPGGAPELQSTNPEVNEGIRQNLIGAGRFLWHVAGGAARAVVNAVRHPEAAVTGPSILAGSVTGNPDDHQVVTDALEHVRTKDGFAEAVGEAGVMLLSRKLPGVGEGEAGVTTGAHSSRSIVRQSNAEAGTVTASSGGEGMSYTRADYTKIPDPGNAGPFKDFTARQTKGYKELNREANGGVLKSDKTGEVIPESEQSRKGVTPDPREANVDHYDPKSLGGANSGTNAWIIERGENIKKSNTPP